MTKQQTWRDSAEDECRAPTGWGNGTACEGDEPPPEPPADTPAPADDPAPAPTTPPPPTQAPEPPAPAPEPPAPSPVDHSAELEALRRERAAAEEARKAMESIVKRTRDADRLKTLRAMRARPELADAHLLALAPDVDVSTDDGRRKLSEWADSDANRGLFLAPETPAVPDQKSYVESLKVDDNPLFGRAYAERIVGKNFGGR